MMQQGNSLHRQKYTWPVITIMINNHTCWHTSHLKYDEERVIPSVKVWDHIAYSTQPESKNNKTHVPYTQLHPELRT